MRRKVSTCIAARGGSHVPSDLSLNSSDSPCVLYVINEVERFIFVPHITLTNYGIITGCCMLVIFRVYYVDTLIFSIYFTSCVYRLLFINYSRIVLYCVAILIISFFFFIF